MFGVFCVVSDPTILLPGRQVPAKKGLLEAGGTLPVCQTPGVLYRSSSNVGAVRGEVSRGHSTGGYDVVKSSRLRPDTIVVAAKGSDKYACHVRGRQAMLVLLRNVSFLLYQRPRKFC